MTHKNLTRISALMDILGTMAAAYLVYNGARRPATHSRSAGMVEDYPS